VLKRLSAVWTGNDVSFSSGTLCREVSRALGSAAPRREGKRQKRWKQSVQRYGRKPVSAWSNGSNSPRIRERAT
jgi:hypothetical protein